MKLIVIHRGQIVPAAPAPVLKPTAAKLSDLARAKRERERRGSRGRAVRAGDLDDVMLSETALSSSTPNLKLGRP